MVLERVLAIQLWPTVGLSPYKGAWLMPHKLRRAMVDLDPPLTGTVEVDETPTTSRRT
ncbi:hypothetical protein [Ferruginivarius sediminum]|uniref:hypothetical protein n=1 Tax=Ferruginivarius sediminum TaxID=2661937 RepID=UPI00129409F9